MAELKALGTEQTKKTHMRHGAREPVFGVKVEDLKKIRKRTGVNYQLALDLYATGNSDAMYLAGLMADDKKMTKADLKKWVKAAYSPWLCGYAVPWVASESKHGPDLAREWIESKTATIAVAGWGTFASLVSLKDDAELNLDEIARLLDRVRTTIHDQPNRVKYAMNSFVIAVGSFVRALSDAAIAAGEEIGKVDVDMGDTDCQVPFAPDYIKKATARGTLTRKRKSARC
jgi:3-methyladenine DNA glycosylase AlkD